MKKFLFVLFVLLAAGTAAFAQEKSVTIYILDQRVAPVGELAGAVGITVVSSRDVKEPDSLGNVELGGYRTDATSYAYCLQMVRLVKSWAVKWGDGVFVLFLLDK